MNGRGCASIRLYLQEQAVGWIRFKGSSWVTSALDDWSHDTTHTLKGGRTHRSFKAGFQISFGVMNSSYSVEVYSIN